ncbi:cytochrome o ubiquinol oxidase subunit IV [Alcanivorax sp. S6407]|uniref:Cytochrome bo(3) ubiquinol oxidase subunit 4 n=1 Tax=Alcanivorax nanhaiticus TaxID=1177154 RepID=A0A095TPY8_9GAMM|nr:MULTISPECIES: cytochrome o ubiquinol oxidase subunit IV [Alcanivorax]KGD64458.1 cytochrome o ubiquinol oxidase, protein CyoD [Alcanivorax nanhaiticus]MCK0153346.1 cytochrome o ubiquinol oxidase subunit IV [Alcanivorax sp. S6407]
MSEHTHEHDHHDDDIPHVSLKEYATGFVLAVILTVIPFWLVMGNVFESSATTVMVILAFALVQIVVHMVYFLHMNFHSEGGWNMLALIFTLILVFITLAGSLWVMYNLNVNMMPGMME